MKAQTKSINNILVISIIALVLLCFSGIVGHDLWTPDEPRVAAISLEMANSGNIIIPHLALEPFIEKPPLYFAVSAIMLHIFGPLIGNTPALRLTSAFFGIGVLIFSFLIAKRFGNKETALVSILILGTMVGFIQNFHWIRVDNALSFFIIASIWCFMEVYFENRAWLLIPAGVCTGMAFLCKGLIGPALIFVPWAGLVIYWILNFKKNKLKTLPWVGLHFLCLISFIITSGIWVVLLYYQGGEKLWNDWFYINQIGRFTGNVNKGHLMPNDPLFYFAQLIVYGMPWTPLFLFWFIKNTISTYKIKIINKETLLFFVWGAGSIILLSIATTKRGIYLMPVMPAFAIMAGLSLRYIELGTLWKKLFTNFAAFWVTLCILFLLIIVFLPVIAGFAPEKISEHIVTVLMHPGYLNEIISLFSLLGLIIFLYIFRKQYSSHLKIVFATAMVFIAFFGLPSRAVDAEKSMQTEIKHFVSSISQTDRNKIAGLNFSETMLGSIYYYTGWKVPQISGKTRIQSILKGKDKDYNFILVDDKDIRHTEQCVDLSIFNYKIIKHMLTRRHRRLLLIKGKQGEQ